MTGAVRTLLAGVQFSCFSFLPEFLDANISNDYIILFPLFYTKRNLYYVLHLALFLFNCSDFSTIFHIRLCRSSITPLLLTSNHPSPHLRPPCPSSHKFCPEPRTGETDLRVLPPVSLLVNLTIKLFSFLKSWCHNNRLFMHIGQRTSSLYSDRAMWDVPWEGDQPQRLIAKIGFWTYTFWIWICAPSLTIFMTLGKQLTISVSPFPYLYNVNNNILHRVVKIQWINAQQINMFYVNHRYYLKSDGD